MDPIINRYISTQDDLPVILSSQPTTPVQKALTGLLAFINGQSADKEPFLVARDLLTDGLDSDLLVLFLGLWAKASILKENRPQASSLLERVKREITDETPAELKAFIQTVEAELAGASGNYIRQERSLRDAFSSIPRHSPRRNECLFELLLFLARSGNLNVMDSEIESLPDHQSGTVRFINSMETGNIASALLFAPNGSTEYSRTLNKDLADYIRLLEILKEADLHAAGSEIPENRSAGDWALVIQCLLSGRSHQALRWARLRERSRPEAVTGLGFISLNLIRAELAEKNADAAGRLIHLRHQSGNHHYLDDLFLTRISLLTGHFDKAAHHFATAYRNAETRGAQGRFHFEIRLSSELPRDTLMKLAETILLPIDANSPHPRPLASSGISLSPAPRQEPDLPGIDRLIGISPTMELIRGNILSLARIDVPVLVTGETGTGKELVAKAIHESGPRRTAPFVAVNCGAISESLLESEIFGHEKGAFSGAGTSRKGLFEEAGDGTLLLDEIGDIPERLQIALLRVLETGEVRPVGSSKSRKVNCRILTATNADLADRIKNGRFRKDLFFRLRRLEIHIPPLRERPEDILPLAMHFLNIDRPAGVYAFMSAGLQGNLCRHAWPGNVRELRNTIEKMRLTNSDKLAYDENDLDLDRESFSAPDTPSLPPIEKRAFTDTSFPDETSSSLSSGQVKNMEPQNILPEVLYGKSRVRRLMRLEELFRARNILTRSETAHTLRISMNTATADLQELCRRGIIEKVMPSASPRSAYFRLR